MLAIIITIMVLELRAPHEASVAALAPPLPAVLSCELVALRIRSIIG